MVVPSAETDFAGDFRRKTNHLHFCLHLIFFEREAIRDFKNINEREVM